MKQLLWIGSFLDESIFNQAVSKGYKNAASYVSQKNLVEGIENEANNHFDIISAISLKGFPIQGSFCLEDKIFNHTENSLDYFGGYLNIVGFNKIFMRNKMVNLGKKWIEERYEYGNDLDIFIYEMRTACITLLLRSC